MIDNSMVSAGETTIHRPTSHKQGRNVIGSVNWKRVYADDPEYLDLRSQVTVEYIPPGTYSDGIRRRLCALQDEMRKPFLDTIEGLTLPELQQRAFKAMVPWQRKVILDRITQAFERRKRVVEELHRRKRIPGLTKLYDTCEDAIDKEILLGMIRQREAKELQRQEEERQRQDEDQRRQKAVSRWQSATLDALLADGDREEFGKEWYAAFRPKVVTVAEIADRLGVSQSTIRKYMPCPPVFVHEFTIGWSNSRKDVTAYFTGRGQEAVAQLMPLRRVKSKLKLVG